MCTLPITGRLYFSGYGYVLTLVPLRLRSSFVNHCALLCTHSALAKEPRTQQLKTMTGLSPRVLRRRPQSLEDLGLPKSRRALKRKSNVERKRRSDNSKRSATLAGFTGGAVIASQAEWMAGSGSAKKSRR